MTNLRFSSWLVLSLLSLGGLAPRAAAQGSRADTEAAALAVADTQAAALERIRTTPDPALRDLLGALKEGALYRYQGRFLILGGDGVLKDLKGQPLVDAAGQPLLPDQGLDAVALQESNTPLLQEILQSFDLFNPDPEVRKGAVTNLGSSTDAGARALLQRAAERESDATIRVLLAEAIAKLELHDSDAATRRKAVDYFARAHSESALGPLRGALDTEPDPQVRDTMRRTIAGIERYLKFRNVVGYVFNGVSLASILLTMSLGLAITFGLMGIINMAHGEMLMLGSYTAYVVQEIFAARFPDRQDYFFLVALPVSILVVGMVGYLLERLVLRFLYGRPLESLLVTWGIGMILQQGARLYFGDQTSVNSPPLFQGGVEALPGLIFPKSRIFIILCSAAALAAVYLLLYRSRVGLRIRAVMQNRNMASCLGISARRIDAWTFALGTAIAGLAGCALSLIGTVDPEVGKFYIVDSFMVVVLGGVGKLLGTVAASVTIGMASKLLEPAIGGTAGAIYAKVSVLVLVILFLQFRPTGMFAARGRVTEVMTR